jgi:hypothetical protein
MKTEKIEGVGLLHLKPGESVTCDSGEVVVLLQTADASVTATVEEVVGWRWTQPRPTEV